MSLPRRTLTKAPFDSRLALDKTGDTMCLSIPPPTSKRKAAVVTALMGAALGFAAAMGAPWPITAVLGIGGALISWVSVRAARTRQELRLRHDGSGQLWRFIGRRGEAIPLSAGQVRARLDARSEGTEKPGHRRVSFVALDHGTSTYELLVGMSDAEQAWVVEEIEGWVGRPPGSPAAGT